jgi:hypothetical protein
MRRELGLMAGRAGATAWAVIAVVLLAFSATYFTGILAHPPPESLEDYSAFYCADRLVTARENPYDDQRIAACERVVTPWRNSVLTAPYPPYALMLIAPLSALPFGIAGALWLCGIVACILGSVVLLARIVGAPLALCAAAFACTMWFPSMISTSMEPYAIFLLLLAAYMLKLKRWTFGAVVLALAMLKPNIALPVCIAAFVGIPQVRFRLLGAGAALFAAQSLYAGPSSLLRYLAFLHTFAGTELRNAWQYSLAYALHMSGASDSVAVTAGWAQYAVAVLAGIGIGILLARRFGRVLIVLTPMAFAVIGGIYSRQQELAAVIPLALALAYVARSVPARYALPLLATPWSAVYGDYLYPPFAMLATGTIVHQLWHPPRYVTLLAAFAAVVVVLSFPNGTVSSNADWFQRHLLQWLGQGLVVVACGLAVWEARTLPAPHVL